MTTRHQKSTALHARSNGHAGPPMPLRDLPLSENARTVLTKRYLRRGPDGKPAETIHEMFWRVAKHVADAEGEMDGDAAQWARRFYDLLTDIQFFPNSPTFTGAGTPLGQLAACFVLAIEDDMGRSEAGIFQTLARRGADPADRRRQWLLLQPPAAQGRAGEVLDGPGDRPGGLPARLRPGLWRDRAGWLSAARTLVSTEEGLLRLDEIVRHRQPAGRRIACMWRRMTAVAVPHAATTTALPRSCACTRWKGWS